MVHELDEENAEAEEQSVEHAGRSDWQKSRCVWGDLQTTRTVSVSQFPHGARVRMSKAIVIVNR